MSEAQKASETAQGEIASLTEKLQTAEATLSEVEKARDEAQAEIASLSEKLQAVETTLTETEKARDEAQAENASLSEKLKTTEEELAAEKETISEQAKSIETLTKEKEGLTAEKAALEEEKATLTKEKDALAGSLAEEQKKSADLETQVENLTAENKSLAQETADLHDVNALDAQIPLDTPNTYFTAADGGDAQITWSRIRYDEKGYPQLWLNVSDKDGLASLIISRTFVDENGVKQTELYTRYPLNGDTPAVRFRTLDKAGAYGVRTVDIKGDFRDFGVLVTVEDVDGNGIIDTLTDASMNVVLLEIENAFSVIK